MRFEEETAATTRGDDEAGDERALLSFDNKATATTSSPSSLSLEKPTHT
jgi:hypothetical protein